MHNTHKSSFSSSLGFVLAAAGSAVGVGNIWRFPYLAARDGGGLFLLIYLVLVLTVGFALLTTDIAIGRKTGKNAWEAFGSINQKWGFLGKLTFLVPMIIMTYYAVIGGWILKYSCLYLFNQGTLAANDNYFVNFITSQYSPIIFMLIFLGITALIVYAGVEKGIEKFSKLIMPSLLIVIIGIAIYSLTLSHTDINGITRTGMQGFKIYLVPNLTGLTFTRFLGILIDAMSQLFFSLSVSMGIMITYGSYVKKEINLNKSIAQIEFFDTSVAFLAGIMIIPAVYVFSGMEGMSSGPSLMFESLPKVFASMGSIGNLIGVAFFIMVLFAALTSCVSIMETLVANGMQIFNKERHHISIITTIYAAVTSTIVCLGYNRLFFNLSLPNGQTGQLLDLVDYISNACLMPIISILTCIFVGYIIKPNWIEEEMLVGAKIFNRKRLYTVMIKYIIPVVMLVIFLQSSGIIKM